MSGPDGGARERAELVLAELEQHRLQTERDRLLGLEPSALPPVGPSLSRERAMLLLEQIVLRRARDELRGPPLRAWRERSRSAIAGTLRPGLCSTASARGPLSRRMTSRRLSHRSPSGSQSRSIRNRLQPCTRGRGVVVRRRRALRRSDVPARRAGAKQRM